MDRRPILRRRALPALLLAALLAACSGGDDEAGGAGETGGAAETGATDGGETAAATGPITIWYSNNEQEIAWGEAVVEAWNAEHPDEQVTAQEIPAGQSSEEVITASITAGNTPCLIFNTAPAAVPQFQRQGGLVALNEFEGGTEYVNERVGEDRVGQYVSADGNLYQMPWKTNPSMIFYNRELFEEAGLDPEDPPLSTYSEFLETSQTLVDEGGARAAIWPSPASQFFQSWFDFYPLFIANSGGQQLVEDGEPQFASEAGVEVAEFWAQMYERGLSPREEAQGDSFAEGQAAMSIVGPWAVAVYSDVDWGVVPVPTPDGMPLEETYTFSDNKSVGLYSSCENRGTAWEFLKFSTSEENDGLLLEETGQMPMRVDLTETYADYFEANPEYETFADQAARTVEVPNVANSIEMWQEFRDAWSESVIFGEAEPEAALTEAAETISGLVGE
jgi:multiple sugar transport system substrate-binding protein